MDEVRRLQKKITISFKLCGFVIRSENSEFLAEQLLPFDDEAEREKLITVVTDSLQGQMLETTNVERSALEKAIQEINRVGLEEGESVFGLIDAFSVPRYRYNGQTKKFERDLEARHILARNAMKAGHLHDRYTMLMQKTLRHELFTPAIIDDGSKKFKLQHAENLLATSGLDEVVILGLLTQLKEGKFYIEDPTGLVELDLCNARFHSGFFCEGCFVLVEGNYANGVLKVDGMGFPPAEVATSSRAFYGTQNSWGGDSEKLLKYSVRLQELERTNMDATFVFLSDVRLDLPVVMERLRMLFIGYDSCPPIAIVLMGPFANTRNNYTLHQLFTALGGLVAGCDHLKKKTDLILVPSTEDPTAPNILPRAPIPESLLVDLRKIWPRTRLATNPCRLQYCTQQIVVCRADLMAKFCRNTLHFPSDTHNIDQHFARTLICQGHLLPINPIVAPVHWEHDAALWLYPLPDLVVIGDSCQTFTTAQHGCTVLNTGSFIQSKFGFKVYIPATRTIEDSEISDNMTSDQV